MGQTSMCIFYLFCQLAHSGLYFGYWSLTRCNEAASKKLHCCIQIPRARVSATDKTAVVGRKLPMRVRKRRQRHCATLSLLLSAVISTTGHAELKHNSIGDFYYSQFAYFNPLIQTQVDLMSGCLKEISHIESGVTEPNFTTCIRYAKATNSAVVALRKFRLMLASYFETMKIMVLINYEGSAYDRTFKLGVEGIELIGAYNRNIELALDPLIEKSISNVTNQDYYSAGEISDELNKLSKLLTNFSKPN
jgi:hypothetical protein